MGVIDRFEGKYSFLSNYYQYFFMIDGEEYKSVEHYYQCMKTLDLTLREAIKNAETPDDAKKLGRKVELRADWERIKFLVMERALWAKFDIPFLKDMLLDTCNAVLIEGTTWNDRIWGIDLSTGEGQNNLGKMLMKIRAYHSWRAESEAAEHNLKCPVCGNNLSGEFDYCPFCGVHNDLKGSYVIY